MCAIGMGAVAIVLAGCDRSPTDPEEEVVASPYYVALGAKQEPRLRVLRSDGTVEATVACPSFDSRAVVPHWSRDGKRLSIACIRDTSVVLYVVDRDGKNIREVASMPRFWVGEGKGAHYHYPDFQEDWSTDGRLIYVRSTPSGTSVETVEVSGSSPPVTIYRDPPGAENPRWNSSGATIVLEMHRQLYAMDANGGNRRLLTPELAAAGGVLALGSHQWSPDGRTVGFISAHADGGTALETVDVPSGQVRRVFSSTSGHRISSFCWSPDGTKVSLVTTYFIASSASGGEARNQLLTLSRDGSNVRQEASDLQLLSAKAPWNPDATELIFIKITALGNLGQQLHTYGLSDGAQTKIIDIDQSFSFAISGGPRCER